MTDKHSYSIANDFNNDIDLRILNDDIILSGIGIDFHISQYGDKVDIIFESTLTANNIITLNNVVANHDSSLTFIPFVETGKVLNNNDIFVATHFLDYENLRKVIITEETFETADNSLYTMNDTLASNYSITNPTIGELTPNAFSLVGTGYQKGSNIAPSGTASASSSTNAPSSAIDNNTNTFWYNSSSEPAVGSWWKIDFGSPKGLHSFEIQWYSTTYYGTDVAIEWSNDDTNWTQIMRDTSVGYTSTGNVTGRYKFADFPTATFARYFRIRCYGSNNSTFFIMRETYLYEAVGSGFSTSQNSTIRNIKENRQVVTSNWQSINSSTIVGTFPSGTTTRILLSFDNQTTWVYWNGSAWTTSSLANISTTSMTHTTFNALTQTNYASANGLNSNSSKTIDIAINIKTSNSTLSPMINYVTFNYNSEIFQEKMEDSSIRVRYIASNQTEFKNISGVTKTVNINISK